MPDIAVPPPVDHGRMIEVELLGGAQTLTMRARLGAHGAHNFIWQCVGPHACAITARYKER